MLRHTELEAVEMGKGSEGRWREEVGARGVTLGSCIHSLCILQTTLLIFLNARGITLT